MMETNSCISVSSRRTQVGFHSRKPADLIWKTLPELNPCYQPKAVTDPAADSGSSQSLAAIILSHMGVAVLAALRMDTLDVTTTDATCLHLALAGEAIHGTSAL